MAHAPVFALNHMAAPRIGVDALFALGGRLGIAAFEIRNDLPGRPILDGTPAASVRAMALAHGARLLSINALQKFNHCDAARFDEATALADYAAASGAEALVLVPANDGTGCADGVRQADVRHALAALRPILARYGLKGLVEPLGFASCSLRSKAEAVAAIDATDGRDVFRLVHDTFHHHVAGEAALFPEMTGLVHISGVEDAVVGVAEMRDSHRVLVGPADRLDNIGQIAALIAGGFRGCFSFEPFAEAVHAAPDPAQAIAVSMAFIRERLAARAS